MSHHPVGPRREDRVLVPRLERIPRLAIGLEELLEPTERLDSAPFVLARNLRVEPEARVITLGTIEGVLSENGLPTEQATPLCGELLELLASWITSLFAILVANC
jgi:hypothetical protein